MIGPALLLRIILLRLILLACKYGQVSNGSRAHTHIFALLFLFAWGLAFAESWYRLEATLTYIYFLFAAPKNPK